MTSLWNASKPRKDEEETAKFGNSFIPESEWEPVFGVQAFQLLSWKL